MRVVIEMLRKLSLWHSLYVAYISVADVVDLHLNIIAVAALAVKKLRVLCSKALTVP